GAFLVAEIRLARHSEEAGVASSPGEVTIPTPVHTPVAQQRLLDAPREVNCLNNQWETTFDDAGCLEEGTKMASSILWGRRNAEQAERAPMLNRLRDRLSDNFCSLWQGIGKVGAGVWSSRNPMKPS